MNQTNHCLRDITVSFARLYLRFEERVVLAAALAGEGERDLGLGVGLALGFADGLEADGLEGAAGDGGVGGEAA